MRYLKIALFGLLFVASLAHAGALIPAWDEQGDAGDRTNPQNVVGGPYFAIFGEIGDPTPPSFDQFDAYRFFFEGGDFGIVLVSIKTLDMRLFTDALTELAPISEEENIEQWGVIDPGNYILEFEATEDPFMQAFLSGAISTPRATIAEPAAWALLLAGLMGLLMLRRRANA